MFNRDPYLDLRRRLRSAATGWDDDLAGVSGTRAPRVGSERELWPSPAMLRKQVAPALIATLERETNPGLLSESVIALARLGDASDVARVQKLIAHAQSSVAESALIALGILGDAHSLLVLEHVAADCAEGRALTSRSPVPYRMRAMSAYAMGLIASGSGNEDVRRFAVRDIIAILESRSAAPIDVQVACISSLGLASPRSETVADKATAPAAFWGSRQAMAGPVVAHSSPARSPLPASASREALIAWLLEAFDAEHLSDGARATTASREQCAGTCTPARSDTWRAHVPTALARLAREAGPDTRAEVEKALLRVLSRFGRESNEVEESCALALGGLGDTGGGRLDREIRSTLMDVAQAGHSNVRPFALIALGQIAARAGQDPEHAREGTAEIQRFLKKTLVSGRNRLQPWAALSLGIAEHALRAQGEPPSKDAARALAAAFQDSSSPEQEAACAVALGLCGDSACAPALRDRLKGAGDDGTRAALALALGLVRSDEDAGTMHALLRGAENHPVLLHETALSLSLLAEKGLVPELCLMLKHAAGSASRTAVLSALGDVGDARCLETLIAVLKDPAEPAAVKSRAAHALGDVGDARGLPWNFEFAHNANYLAATETLTDPRGDGILDIE